jgi:acyl-CoA synthetase (AMP-forming)/AMP-acid ligase II
MIRSIVDLVRLRAHSGAENLAYSFLEDGGSKRKTVSFAQLEREARRVAVLIAERIGPGSRLALLYPQGIEFLTAFFGCLFAGVIAVPVYPPAPPRLDGLARLEHILRSSGSEAILSSLQLPSLAALRRHYAHLTWILTDGGANPDPEAWRDPAVQASDIALLQYTSGSTADPKGVVLRHGNLLENLRSMHWFLREPSSGSMVSWLPMYHDMGLIGTALYPLSQGLPCYLLSTLHFLQRPVRWLRLISEVRGTISGGPNFAYDLCVSRISEQELNRLDLSCWEIAFNGSEPIRADTVSRFESYFSRAGLRPNTLMGCYGLAETTLLATGAHPGRGPRILRVDMEQLRQGKFVAPAAADSVAVEVVSCGAPAPEQKIRIVDPETHRDAAPGRVGEIWLQGPSTAAGYWNDEFRTRETFRANIATENGDVLSYLRTGDLGVLHEGELFVTGRLKDLIIIRGRNLHPQDIEDTAQLVDSRLRPRRGVAFPIESAEGESIGLIQETTAKEQRELERLARGVREAIFQQLQVAPAVIYFVGPRSVQMTSSGKLRRHATKVAVMSGQVNVLLEHRVSVKPFKNVAGVLELHD